MPRWRPTATDASPRPTPGDAHEDRPVPRHRRLGLASLLIGAAPAARADIERAGRFQLSVGAFLVSLNTQGDVSVASERDGTEVDFEDSFGLAHDVDELRVEGHVRLGRRHRIFWDWFALGRDRTAELEKDWVFADATLLAGTEAKLSADLSVLGVGYRYDAVSREKFELGLSIAASILDVKAKLSGTGTVDTDTGPEPFAGERSASVSAPVPLLGVHSDFLPSEHWTVTTSLQYLQADLGDFGGSMLQADARLNWFPVEHFGVGPGMSHGRVALNDYEESGLDGDLAFEYSGVYGFLTVRF